MRLDHGRRGTRGGKAAAREPFASSRRVLSSAIFPPLFIAGLLLFAGCGNPVDRDGGRFTFVVADVGQGLAQFGVMGGRAVVWDAGLPGQYAAWRGAYDGLGRPRLESVIISHSDNDHYGGLEFFDDVDWSGEVVVSPHEDTAKIRASAASMWRDRVKFSFCVRGDTLRYLSGVDIICLWPPALIDNEPPFDSRLRNHYSLVFSVRHGRSRVLVTSDIDSAAMAALAAQSGYDLRAQILLVPHHGSAGSVNPLFFSYVSADAAVISCARQNSYGHPARTMVDELTNQGIYVMYTYLDGTVTFTSNGYYWD